MRIVVLAAGLVLIALALVGGLAGRGGNGTAAVQTQTAPGSATPESAATETSGNDGAANTVAAAAAVGTRTARVPSPYEVYTPLPSTAGRELLTPFRVERDPAARALGERGGWRPGAPGGSTDSPPADTASEGASALVHASLPPEGQPDVPSKGQPNSPAKGLATAPATRTDTDARSGEPNRSAASPAASVDQPRAAPAGPSSTPRAVKPPETKSAATATPTVSAPAAAARSTKAETETTVARLTPQDQAPPAQAPPVKAPPVKAPQAQVPQAQVPVTRPPASAVTAPPPAPSPAASSAATEPGPETPAVAASSNVAEAQSLLARLGYNVGPADGYTGPRTAAAVRAFQQANGMWVDGEIDEALLVALEDKVDERAQRLRPSWQSGAASAPPASADRGRSGPPPTRRSPTPPPSSTGGGTAGGGPEDTVSSIVSGLQRMIGHEFDSVHAPGDLLAFCDAHADNWVYDEGTGRFLFCAEVNAGIVGDSR